MTLRPPGPVPPLPAHHARAPRRGIRLVWAGVLSGVLAACAGNPLQREGRALIQAGNFEEGLARLEQASQAAPHDFSLRADLLRGRAQAVALLLRGAEAERAGGRPDSAQALYQRVLGLEPDNRLARDGLAALARDQRHQGVLAEARALLKDGDPDAAEARLRGVLLDGGPAPETLALRREIEAAQARRRQEAPTLRPRFKKPITLQFRDANLKMVFEALSRTTGINILLDRDVKADQKTNLFVNDASLEDTIDLLLLQNQLEKKVLSENTVFIYPATTPKLKEFQDLKIRTFHLVNADAKQMLVLLKTILKTRDLFIDEKNNSLIMRDTPEAVRLAEKLVASQDTPEPEVMLEVEVLEVLHSRLSELGINWPSQIGLSVTEAAATTQSVIGSGGAVTTTTTPAAPLTLETLKQLGAADIKVSSLSAAINLKKEVGDSNLLASPRIRARNREKAKIHIGDRVPVITNTVTPVSTGTPVVTGSVQYLDVGLKLEVEPEVHADGDVAIKVALEVSSIVKEIISPAASGGTVAYQIGTRTASTTLRLRDGETQVLAGLINDEDRKTASKLPGLGDLPFLGRLFSSHKSDARKSEIILSITPRVLRNPQRGDASLAEYWSGTESSLRTSPLALQTGSVVRMSGGGPGYPTSGPGQAAAAPQRPIAALPGAAARKPSAEAGTAPSQAPALPLAVAWQGPLQARVGQPFTLALTASAAGAASILSIPMVVGYDPAQLKVLEVQAGDFLRGGEQPFSHDVDTAAGQVYLELSGTGAEPVAGQGSLASLTFEPLPGADQVHITVQGITATGAGGKPLPVAAPGAYLLRVTP